MYSFGDIQEAAKAFGPKVLVAGALVSLGVVAFKKFHKRMKITVNGLNDNKLNITVCNLTNKKMTATYHFVHGDLQSKKFSVALNPKESRQLEISDEILETATVDGIRFHIDTAKCY